MLAACEFLLLLLLQTVGGARFLRQQLLRPSADVATIRARDRNGKAV